MFRSRGLPPLDKKPGRGREFLMSLPSIAWLMAFLLVPTLMVFATSFRAADPYGGISEEWTLDTIRTMTIPNFPSIIWRTIWLSVAATAICLAMSIPVGYCLARISERWRQWIMLGVVVPFWTSFLIRVFAWKTILHSNGFLVTKLRWLGVLGENDTLLHTSIAVLLVLVYTHLPFAILPIYAAAEKFDFGLLEAARDLGSGAFGAFCRVFLPGISRGLATAGIMVLVPCLGSYVIPEMLGGTSNDMIGNKITEYVFNQRNLPRASALSAILTVVVVALLLAFLLWSNRRRRTGVDSVPKGNEGMFS